jgi:hypothetical protein
MIKYIVVVLLALMCGGVMSCKQCITCKNRCYVCVGSVDTLCNTDYPTDQLFDTLLVSYARTGHPCTEVTSLKSQTLCDSKSSLNNYRTVYEDQRYKCQ